MKIQVSKLGNEFSINHEVNYIFNMESKIKILLHQTKKNKAIKFLINSTQDFFHSH